VQHKGAGDWFSSIDLEMEALIRERIERAYPAHGFLGEEGGAIGTQELMWVVDPIDGSMNFLRGYPHYSVALALVQNGEPVVACVADPSRHELFSASLGGGAHLNGVPLRVHPVQHLSEAVAATVFPKPGARFMGPYVQCLGRVLERVAGARRSGSMVLDLAYLAAGRIDLFWSQGMGAWDAAAGVLLIREAGGEVFTLDGLPWMESAGIAAATPALAGPWRGLLTETV